MKEERPFPKWSHSAVRHKTNPVTRVTLKWSILKKENKKKRRNALTLYLLQPNSNQSEGAKATASETEYPQLTLL